MTEQPRPDAGGDSPEPPEDTQAEQPENTQRPGPADAEPPRPPDSSLVPESDAEPPPALSPLPPAQAYPGPYGDSGGSTQWAPPPASWPASPAPSGGYPWQQSGPLPPPPPGQQPAPGAPWPQPGVGAPGQPGVPGMPPPGAQPGYPTAFPVPPQGGYAVPPAAPHTDSKAIVGLILAICSWVICPVVLAVVALVLAGQSDRAIAQAGGWLEGRGMNTATRWISWINIALTVVVLVFVIAAGLLALQWGSIELDDPTQF